VNTIILMVTSKGFCTTMRDMAKLREQAGLVRKLHDFYGLTNYSGEETRKYRLANQRKGGVPEKDFLDYLQLNDFSPKVKIKLKILSIKKNNFNRKTQFLFDRKDKIDRLYKSCLNDGFIEPAVFTTEDVGNRLQRITYIRVSKKGSDLIHFAGFWEETQKKYPLTWRAVGKITASVVAILSGTGVVGYLLIEIVKHFILHLPY